MADNINIFVKVERPVARVMGMSGVPAYRLPHTTTTQMYYGIYGEFFSVTHSPLAKSKNFISLRSSQQPNFSNIYSESTIDATDDYANVLRFQFSP